MTNANYLAFDFGMRSIGVAIGQSITKTANMLPSIQAREGVPAWEQIESLLKEWKPKALIVGIPVNMDDTEQPLTFAARKFADRLREKSGLDVYGVDERLTTVEARARIYAQGGYRALKKGVVDSMSAKIILEAWLNRAKPEEA